MNIIDFFDASLEEAAPVRDSSSSIGGNNSMSRSSTPANAGSQPSSPRLPPKRAQTMPVPSSSASPASLGFGSYFRSLIGTGISMVYGSTENSAPSPNMSGRRSRTVSRPESAAASPRDSPTELFLPPMQSNNANTAGALAPAVDSKPVSPELVTTNMTAEPAIPLQHSVAEIETPAHIKLYGRFNATKPVLTDAMAMQLHPHLPPLQRLGDTWQLVYSMDQHGTSLTTLYDRIRSCIYNKVVQPRGFILVIVDSNGKKFGSYMSDPLKIQQHFFGTGETFVFDWDDTAQKAKIYPWTAMNDYLLFAEPHYFAIGSGEGKFAIWLDAALEYGKSHPVPTFDNPTLASNSDFVCYDLEIWGVAP